MKTIIRSIQWQKIIASTVFILFTATEVLWSAPAAVQIKSAQSAIGQDGIIIPQLAQRIEIPDAYGEIKQRYIPLATLNPANGQNLGIDHPVVIHLQDAHSSLDAQKSISEILDYVTREYGIESIFLEGGIDEVDADLLRFFKEEAVNQELAGHMAREGLIGGAELFLLEHTRSLTDPNKAVKIYGVENPSLYRENLAAFRAVYAEKETADIFLNDLKQRIVTHASIIFNKPLKRFFKEWLVYRDMPNELMRHLNTLKETAEDTLDADFLNPRMQLEWPQIVRFAHLQEMEAGLDTVKADDERMVLLQWMSDNNLDAGLIDAVKRLQFKIRFKDKNFTGPRHLLETLYDKAGGAGFSFNTYPHLKREWSAAILQSEISVTPLFNEVERLTDRILGEMAVSEEEEELISIYKDYLSIDRLLKLELVYDKYLELESRKDSIRPSAVLGRLDDLAHREQSQPTSLFGISLSRIDRLFSRALSFYQGAVAREQKIFESMISKMAETGQTKVVLITGGFHARGLQTLLADHGLSYVEVMPHISKIGNQDTYAQVMTQDIDYLTRRSYANTPRFAGGDGLSTLRTHLPGYAASYGKHFIALHASLLAGLHQSGRLAVTDGILQTNSSTAGKRHDLAIDESTHAYLLAGEAEITAGVVVTATETGPKTQTSDEILAAFAQARLNDPNAAIDAQTRKKITDIIGSIDQGFLENAPRNELHKTLVEWAAKGVKSFLPDWVKRLVGLEVEPKPRDKARKGRTIGTGLERLEDRTPLTVLINPGDDLGEALQRAADQGAEKVIVYGEIGHSYEANNLSVPAGIQVEGRFNPVIQGSLDLTSGSGIDGVSLVGEEGASWVLHVGAGQSHIRLNNVNIDKNGADVAIKSEGGVFWTEDSIIVGAGTLVDITNPNGLDNRFTRTLLNSFDTIYDESGNPLETPVIHIHQSGGSHILEGNTILGNQYSVGVQFDDNVGDTNVIGNSVLKGHGVADVVAPASDREDWFVVQVHNSWLEKGTIINGDTSGIRVEDIITQADVSPGLVNGVAGDFRLQLDSPLTELANRHVPVDPLDGRHADLGALPVAYHGIVTPAEREAGTDRVSIFPNTTYLPTVQSAINSAVERGFNKVIIYGDPQSEHIYDVGDLIIPQGFVIEGRNDAILQGRIVLNSGSVIRGVRLLGNEGADEVVRIDEGTTHVRLESVVIEENGAKTAYNSKGSVTRLTNSVVRGRGTVAVLSKSLDQRLDGTLLHAVDTHYDENNNPVEGLPVLVVHDSPGDTFIFNSTIVGNPHSSGVLFRDAGNNNEVRNSVIAKHGGSEVIAHNNAAGAVTLNHTYVQRGRIPVNGEVVTEGLFTQATIGVPRFVSASNGDYRLRHDSPLIDRGIERDIKDGTSRDLGYAPFDQRALQKAVSPRDRLDAIPTFTGEFSEHRKLTEDGNYGILFHGTGAGHSQIVWAIVYDLNDGRLVGVGTEGVISDGSAEHVLRGQTYVFNPDTRTLSIGLTSGSVDLNIETPDREAFVREHAGGQPVTFETRGNEDVVLLQGRVLSTHSAGTVQDALLSDTTLLVILEDGAVLKPYLTPQQLDTFPGQVKNYGVYDNNWVELTQRQGNQVTTTVVGVTHAEIIHQRSEAAGILTEGELVANISARRDWKSVELIPSNNPGLIGVIATEKMYPGTQHIYIYSTQRDTAGNPQELLHDDGYSVWNEIEQAVIVDTGKVVVVQLDNPYTTNSGHPVQNELQFIATTLDVDDPNRILAEEFVNETGVELIDDEGPGFTVNASPAPYYPAGKSIGYDVIDTTVTETERGGHVPAAYLAGLPATEGNNAFRIVESRSPSSGGNQTNYHVYDARPGQERYVTSFTKSYAFYYSSVGSIDAPHATADGRYVYHYQLSRYARSGPASHGDNIYVRGVTEDAQTRSISLRGLVAEEGDRGQDVLSVQSYGTLNDTNILKVTYTNHVTNETGLRAYFDLETGRQLTEAETAEPELTVTGLETGYAPGETVELQVGVDVANPAAIISVQPTFFFQIEGDSRQFPMPEDAVTYNEDTGELTLQLPAHRDELEHPAISNTSTGRAFDRIDLTYTFHVRLVASSSLNGSLAGLDIEVVDIPVSGFARGEDPSSESKLTITQSNPDYAYIRVPVDDDYEQPGGGRVSELMQVYKREGSEFVLVVEMIARVGLRETYSTILDGVDVSPDGTRIIHLEEHRGLGSRFHQRSRIVSSIGPDGITARERKVMTEWTLPERPDNQVLSLRFAPGSNTVAIAAFEDGTTQEINLLPLSPRNEGTTFSNPRISFRTRDTHDDRFYIMSEDGEDFHTFIRVHGGTITVAEPDASHDDQNVVLAHFGILRGNYSADITSLQVYNRVSGRSHNIIIQHRVNDTIPPEEIPAQVRFVRGSSTQVEVLFAGGDRQVFDVDPDLIGRDVDFIQDINLINQAEKVIGDGIEVSLTGLTRSGGLTFVDPRPVDGQKVHFEFALRGNASLDQFDFKVTDSNGEILLLTHDDLDETVDEHGKIAVVINPEQLEGLADIKHFEVEKKARTSIDGSVVIYGRSIDVQIFEPTIISPADVEGIDLDNVFTVSLGRPEDSRTLKDIPNNRLTIEYNTLTNGFAGGGINLRQDRLDLTEDNLIVSLRADNTPARVEVVSVDPQTGERGMEWARLLGIQPDGELVYVVDQRGLNTDRGYDPHDVQFVHSIWTDGFGTAQVKIDVVSDAELQGLFGQLTAGFFPGRNESGEEVTRVIIQDGNRQIVQEIDFARNAVDQVRILGSALIVDLSVLNESAETDLDGNAVAGRGNIQVDWNILDGWDPQNVLPEVAIAAASRADGVITLRATDADGRGEHKTTITRDGIQSRLERDFAVVDVSRDHRLDDVTDLEVARHGSVANPELIYAIEDRPPGSSTHVVRTEETSVSFFTESSDEGIGIVLGDPGFRQANPKDFSTFEQIVIGAQGSYTDADAERLIRVELEGRPITRDADGKILAQGDVVKDSALIRLDDLFTHSNRPFALQLREHFSEFDFDKLEVTHIHAVSVSGEGNFTIQVQPTEDNTYDVNFDGQITPVDALMIINLLNRQGGPVPDIRFDVNEDGFVSPLDVLLIINYLNTRYDAEGEAARVAAGGAEGELPVVLDLRQEGDTRVVRGHYDSGIVEHFDGKNLKVADKARVPRTISHDRNTRARFLLDNTYINFTDAQGNRRFGVDLGEEAQVSSARFNKRDRHFIIDGATTRTRVNLRTEEVITQKRRLRTIRPTNLATREDVTDFGEGFTVTTSRGTKQVNPDGAEVIRTVRKKGGSSSVHVNFAAPPVIEKALVLRIASNAENRRGTLLITDDHGVRRLFRVNDLRQRSSQLIIPRETLTSRGLDPDAIDSIRFKTRQTAGKISRTRIETGPPLSARKLDQLYSDPTGLMDSLSTPIDESLLLEDFEFKSAVDRYFADEDDDIDVRRNELRTTVLEDQDQRQYWQSQPTTREAVVETIYLARRTIDDKHRVREDVFLSLLDDIAPVVAQEAGIDEADLRNEIETSVQALRGLVQAGTLVLDGEGAVILTTSGDLKDREALLLTMIPLMSVLLKKDQTGKLAQSFSLVGENAAKLKQAVYAKESSLSAAEKGFVGQAIRFITNPAATLASIVHDEVARQHARSRGVAASLTSEESSQLSTVLTQILKAVESPEEIADYSDAESLVRNAEAYLTRALLLLDLAEKLSLNAETLKKQPGNIAVLIREYLEEKLPDVAIEVAKDGSFNLPLHFVARQLAIFKAAQERVLESA